jgi:hypothetical protein
MLDSDKRVWVLPPLRRFSLSVQDKKRKKRRRRRGKRLARLPQISRTTRGDINNEPLCGTPSLVKGCLLSVVGELRYFTEHSVL